MPWPWWSRTENDFLTDVTMDELALIFSTAQKWSDVRPEWPAEDILRYSPGTDSGTFDYFVEAVMNPTYVKDATADAGKGEEAILNAENLQLSEDDNVLVQGVEGSPYSIGYFGYAYYNENKDRLNALSVNGVVPTEETAEDNSYPLSRPLFIYSDASDHAEQAAGSRLHQLLPHQRQQRDPRRRLLPGFHCALDEAKQAWLDATGQ